MRRVAPSGERWAGAVLTGGASRRMGADKALLPIDGVAMAVRVATALTAAGAVAVRCVGGDLEALEALGLVAVPDDDPGAGPLGGVLTALRYGTDPIVVVAPCDLVAPDPEGFAALVAALTADDGALAAAPSRTSPLPVALRAAAVPALQTSFETGERALHRALAGVRMVEVPTAEHTDADVPGDLSSRRGPRT